MKAKPFDVVQERKTFMDNTFSLAKSLHFINLAKQYLDDVRRGTNGEVKLIFNQYIQKCDWILGDLKNRLNQQSREALAKELEGSLDMDAIMDKVIHLDNQQIAFIETVIDALIKGEEVIVEHKNENTCQE